MIAKSTKEYNAFGPWIIEINEEYTMPPLFVGHYREDKTPLMLIKIPRKIDRADATPDMNLYDYVIGAFDEHLYILKRAGDSVEQRRVFYEDIIAIKNVISLLKGQLFLYLGDETVTVDYNTVSEPIMMKMVDIIRERYKKENKTLEIETISHEIDSIEHLYSAIIDQYKAADQKIRLVAYQPPSKFVPVYRGFKEKMKALLKIRKVITSTAFITNDTELIVLQRDKRTRGRKQGDLTYSALFLPYASIETISKTTGTQDSKLNSMVIATKSEVFSFLYGDNSRQISALYGALKKLTNGAF